MKKLMKTLFNIFSGCLVVFKQLPPLLSSLFGIIKSLGVKNPSTGDGVGVGGVVSKPSGALGDALAKPSGDGDGGVGVYLSDPSGAGVCAGELVDVASKPSAGLVVGDSKRSVDSSVRVAGGSNPKVQLIWTAVHYKQMLAKQASLRKNDGRPYSTSSGDSDPASLGSVKGPKFERTPQLSYPRGYPVSFTDVKEIPEPTPRDVLETFYSPGLIKEYGLTHAEFVRSFETVKHYETVYDKNLRCIIFKFKNPRLLNIVAFMFGALSILLKHKEYKLFGSHKVLISSGLDAETGVMFSVHSNVSVHESDTVLAVLRSISIGGLSSFFHSRDLYLTDVLGELHIKVWDMSKYANRQIKINKKTRIITDLATGKLIDRTVVFKSGSIFQSKGFHTSAASAILTPTSTPKKNVKKNEMGILKKCRTIKPFGTGDIETVNINNAQVPIAISCCYGDETSYFQVDRDLMHSDTETAVQKMFNEYFEYVFKQESKVTFFHNLGGFDGRYVYKALIKYARSVDRLEYLDCLMDAGKAFISISYTYNDEGCTVKFQDSMRLFGVSLKKLCKVYGVEGKTSDYNLEFNKLEVLDNPELLPVLKEYSIQDSKCLYDALLSAQSIYFINYSVDITQTLSTASLSKKIFRTHFLDNPIPTLNAMTDAFVRQAYFGGATDAYLQRGKNLYYYDVNSLYPYVMKKVIPTEVLKRYGTGESIDINTFFGYIKCVVHAPEGIKNPIIPMKTKGRTLYPTGSWEGVYFSEMIKEAMKHGYTFEFKMGLEFKGEYIFEKYIDHFYKIKADSKDRGDETLTFLAKMHLNQLYGVFGMKHEGIETIVVKSEDFEDLLLTEKIKSTIFIDEDTVVVLVERGGHVGGIGITDLTEIEGGSTATHSIQCNVAIAAAVTAYGQIEMMKYKNNPDYNIYYTDTDSIFIDKPLPSHLVGDALGQMKNETKDKYGVETIEEAIFLGVKKYGYTVVKDNETHESSVFAGVKRDSLSFETINLISRGEEHKVSQPTRLYKSSSDFSILQKDDLVTTVTRDFHKELIGNEYVPIKI